MSEPSFLDWYPRGRLAFLAIKQSSDLKGRIQFSDSIGSALLIFIKIRSELRTILDAWSLSEKNGDVPSFRLPSAFHISPDPQDFSNSQVSEESRSCLSLTDYVCRLSGEFFSHLTQHPIFLKALEKNPTLFSLSGAPVLSFDRAIYVIDLGEGADQLMIESSFPPAQFDPSLDAQEFSDETIFVDSLGVTSALIGRDGKVEVFTVVDTRPFFSKLGDDNKNSINSFFQENVLSLIRLLETETLIIKNLAEYFASGFYSSVHLLKNREALWAVSMDGIDV